MRKFVLLTLLFFAVPFGFAQNDPLNINGYLSVDYLDGRNEMGDPYRTLKDPKLGLVLSGQIAANINFAAEVMFQQDTKQDAHVELNQALMEFSASSAFNFGLGLYLVPFGRYNENSRAYQTFLIEPPLSVKSFYPIMWRDMGIQVYGTIAGLLYSVYVGNGLAEKNWLNEGQQFKDNNKDKAFGGRAAWNVDQKFEVGYSHYRGKYDENNSRNLVLQCLDVSFISQSYQLIGEYTWADNENPADYAGGSGEGYFALLTFDIQNFWPVVSYQHSDYEDPFHGAGYYNPDFPGTGMSENRRRWTLGLVYNLGQTAFVKLEYQFNQDKEYEKKDDVLWLQVAVSF